MKPKFIEIQPFEYQYPKNTFPRLITYYGFQFSPELTQEIIKKIIKDLKPKKKISITTNPNEMLVWQYEGKPPIALNKTENKIYTTQDAINYFGMDDCQKQAAYVLQVVRKYGFAEFIQFVVRFDYNRLGRTPEERKLTYEALERLAKKKERYSLNLKPSKRSRGRRIHAKIGYKHRRENR